MEILSANGLAIAIKGGKNLIQNDGGGCTEWIECSAGLAIKDFHFKEVRIKPEFKTVDMTAMVGTGLDCVFDMEYIGDLTGRRGSGSMIPMVPVKWDHQIDGDEYHLSCRPRLNKWMVWTGGDSGECPVPDGVVFSIRYRDASMNTGCTASNWGLRKSDMAIINIKIDSLIDGWEWPGEP